MIKILIHHGKINKDFILPHLLNDYILVKYEIIPLINSPWSSKKFKELISEISKPLPDKSLFKKYKNNDALEMDISQSFNFFAQSKLYEKKWYRHVVLHLEKKKDS